MSLAVLTLETDKLWKSYLSGYGGTQLDKIFTSQRSIRQSFKIWFLSREAILAEMGCVMFGLGTNQAGEGDRSIGTTRFQERLTPHLSLGMGSGRHRDDALEPLRQQSPLSIDMHPII